MATLADSIPNEDCYTIDDLSEEFGLGIARMRQIITKAIKEKIVPNVSKKDGRTILYAPQMVEALKIAKQKGLLGKFSKKSNVIATKHAELVISVPIFDSEIAVMLKKKFENEAGISKYLKSKLEESVKPIMIKRREIQERYEKELQALLHSDMSL